MDPPPKILRGGLRGQQSHRSCYRDPGDLAGNSEKCVSWRTHSDPDDKTLSYQSPFSLGLLRETLRTVDVNDVNGSASRPLRRLSPSPANAAHRWELVEFLFFFSPSFLFFFGETAFCFSPFLLSSVVFSWFCASIQYRGTVQLCDRFSFRGLRVTGLVLLPSPCIFQQAFPSIRRGGQKTKIITKMSAHAPTNRADEVQTVSDLACA